jgi:hypothetical protein
MERRAALCYLASFVLLHRFAFAQQSPGVPATPPTDTSQVRAGIQFAPEGDPAFRPSQAKQKFQRLVYDVHEVNQMFAKPTWAR